MVRIIETTNPNSSSDSEEEDLSCPPPPPPPHGSPKLYHTSEYIAKFSSKIYPMAT